jgi:hypothetical protein
MSLARPFEIQNEIYYFLNHSKDMSYPKKSAMVTPYILVVANVERFAPCKNGLCPFCNHYAIFEAAI